MQQNITLDTEITHYRSDNLYGCEGVNVLTLRARCLSPRHEFLCTELEPLRHQRKRYGANFTVHRTPAASVVTNIMFPLWRHGDGIRIELLQFQWL
jgi:hypothetical protein